MTQKLEFIIGAKDQFSGTFKKLTGYLPSVKTLAIGAAGGVAAAGAATFAMAKSTAEAYDKVQKLGDQLGVSNQFLSKMQVAANFSGIAVGTMNKAVQKLQVGLGEAAKGTGTARSALDDLGISLGTANGKIKTAEQIMPELADKLHGVTDATQRAELASKLFGQRGVEMLQMFTGGADGLKSMTDEADRFGLTISAKAGAQAAAFNDALYRGQLALTGIKNAIAEQAMPWITGLANRFSDFAANNRGQILAFAETFIVTMGKIAEKGAYGVAILVDSWRGLKMIWEVLMIGFSSLSSLLLSGVDAMTSKLLSFMEAVNIRGVFDGAIEKVKGFVGANQHAIEALDNTANTAWGNLDALAAEKMAVNRVGEFSEKVKTVLAEIRAAGTVEMSGDEPQGIGMFSTANLEKTRENIALHQEEQLMAQEELQMLREQYLMTETERIDAWHAQMLKKYENDKKGRAVIDTIYHKRRKKEEDKVNAAKLQSEKEREDSNYALLRGARIKGFDLSKVSSLKETYINARAAASGAYKALSHIPVIGPALGAAAAAVAYGFGMQQAAGISGINLGGAAHGGLDYVPKEQTYLLDRGERVLSPRQNQDLSDFMSGGQGSQIVVEQLVLEVLPNATNASALLDMDRQDWRDIAEDQIIPALRDLATVGIDV